MVVSRAAISISYHGPAVDQGEMDIEDYAPSLLSLGKLIGEVNSLLNEDQGVALHTRIVATRDGSLDIDLSIVQPAWDAVRGLFVSSYGTLSVKAILVAIFGKAGLIAVIKRLKGRPTEDKMLLEETAEGRKIKLHGDIERLVRSRKVRRFLGGYVSPISRDGYDYISSKSSNVDIDTTITAEEARASRMFDAVPYRTTVSTDYIDYAVITASFTKGHKWRLSRGRKSILVSVTDNSLFSKIRNKTEFGLRDRLQGRLDKVMLPPDGRMSYEMSNVIKHYKTDEIGVEKDILISVCEDDHDGYSVISNSANIAQAVPVEGEVGVYHILMPRRGIVGKIASLSIRSPSVYIEDNTTDAVGALINQKADDDDETVYDDIKDAIAACVLRILRLRAAG